MNKPAVLLILLTLVLHSPVVKAQTRDHLINQYIVDKMQEFKIPGLALVVIRKNQVVHQSNYGLTSIEFNIPVTDSTIFPLASVTKLFTSTLIFKLVEQQKLDINQSVTTFIDDLPESWKSITVTHLLNHTSGIKNHFRTQEWLSSTPDESTLSMRDYIQYSVREPLQFEPGEQFSYSVTGYMLLAMIAEKVTGKGMDDLAKDLLFDPLKMLNTQYGDYRAIIKNRNSLVYTYQNGPFETWNFDYGPAGTSAAGLNSTTTDLAKFFIALNDGKALTKKSMRTAMSPTRLNDGSYSNYGLGWTCNDHQGIKYYGHEGGGCCWINYYPSEELTVIVMSNLTGSRADEIVLRVADYFIEGE